MRMMKGEQGESEDKKRVLTKKKEMNNGRVLKKGVTLERIFMFLLSFPLIPPLYLFIWSFLLSFSVPFLVL